MSAPTAFFLDLDWTAAHQAYARAGLIGGEGRQGSMEYAGEMCLVGCGLARAIASSPGWHAYPPGVVVVRNGSPPLLGILFTETVSDTRSLEVRAGHLPLALELLRFRGWEQVVEDATVLADLLRAELSGKDLERAKWMAIPRGGRIVLGLLTYLLDLPPGAPEGEAGAPVVIVDDCVLSGRRLAEQLADLDGAERVYVATLFSNPELRTMVVDREPRVRGILSARDLEDHASERYGEDEVAWRERWAERGVSETYWVGLPDHICFPWNEPDTGLWNGTEEIPAWRVLSPDVCLKNRPGSEDALPVKVMGHGSGQEEGRESGSRESGYMVPAPNVLAGSVGDTLILAERARGRSLRLTGSARAMWNVSTQVGSRRSAAKELAMRFGADEEGLHDDLVEFEAHLVEGGFLEHRS